MYSKTTLFETVIVAIASLSRALRLVSLIPAILYGSMSGASDFGSTGLITLPTARMQADGSLTATLALNDVSDLYNITFQATPSIEATFRYAIFDPRVDRTKAKDDLRDRSYEVKFRLLQESRKLPAVAIGARDILGTGVWSGEYIVGSKSIKGFDVSVGVGWGRLAGRRSFSNPLEIFSGDFANRPRSDGGSVGGEVRVKSFFRGDVGLFGGVRYSVPSKPWAFTLEYTSDTYQREVRLGSLRKSNPINYGFEWTVTEGVKLAASYQQGSFLGLTLSSTVNFKKRPDRRFEQFYSVAIQQGRNIAPERLDLDAWYDRLLFDAERSGLRIHAAYFQPGDDHVGFTISNDRYAVWADALNQFFLLSEIHLPDALRKITVETLEDNLVGNAVQYQRVNIVKSSGRVSVHQRLNQATDPARIKILPGSQLVRPAHRTDFGYPKLALGADLALRVQLMDPDAPLKHQLYIKGTGRIALSESYNIWSAVTIDVSNDFTTKRTSDSVLPRVRSEVNQYLTKGENALDFLFLERRTSISSSLHSVAYVGILEEMFGGAGVEFLYEPFASRWALGANLNWVKQRDFDKRFSFRDYQAFTGHTSVYYASPWFDLDFGLHVGQYLAKDLGYTFETRRTFDNGFSIGGFFTRTNVSAIDFGEGSFDKGMFLSIPYSLLLPRNTRGRYSTIVRSIERDGGRRLEGIVGNLWWNRRATRFDALQNNRGRIAP